MENAGSVLSIVFAVAVVGYLGYRVNKERQRLREKVAILKEKDTPWIEVLEELARRQPAPAPAS